MFTRPVPFKEAIASRELKTVLPTSASSAELSTLEPAIRERAMFSARTANADYLDSVNRLITRILSPETAAPGETMNPATARLGMKSMLQGLGYQPDPDQRGGLQDLSSDARLNLIVATNTQMAQGHGAWLADQDPARLEAWPAQELYRLEQRDKPRDWATRWLAAGGQIYQGRMIALKNDPVWAGISAFGLEYPPFDYNSGMWVRDISRSEAVQLGVMAPEQSAPTPADTRGFNEGLKASVDALSPALQEALVKTLGGAARIVDGVLKFVGGA